MYTLYGAEVLTEFRAAEVERAAALAVMIADATPRKSSTIGQRLAATLVSVARRLDPGSVNARRHQSPATTIS